MKSVARAAVGWIALVAAGVPSVALGQSVPPGEELYTDYFGCWTCHGPRGGGGDGRPLRGTYLPLALFIKELRLPAGEMPPFSDLLATDDELATVYTWLEGVDSVGAPMPLVLHLATGSGAGPGGGEVTLTTGRSNPGGLGPGDDSRFRRRLTLMKRDNSVVADQPLQLQRQEGAEWEAMATDPYGRLLLGPQAGTALSELPPRGGETARFRLTLPQGTYVLVVEAISTENPGDPVILGVGSVVVPIQ